MKKVLVVNPIDGFFIPDVYTGILHTEEGQRMLKIVQEAEKIKYSHLTREQRNADIQPVRDKKVNPKIGRNEPCPCGSGKKFKKCCGILTDKNKP